MRLVYGVPAAAPAAPHVTVVSAARGAVTERRSPTWSKQKCVVRTWRVPSPGSPSRVERMTRKLLTKAGAAVYARRKTMVEPVLGQIKQARGFRQFLLRGVAKVQGEWALVCTTHNILKLYRLCT